MTTKPAMPRMLLIYSGGYVPDLAISLNDKWLCYRHPDGQWVTLADMKKVFSQFNPAENNPTDIREIAALRNVIQSMKAGGDFQQAWDHHMNPIAEMRANDEEKFI